MRPLLKWAGGKTKLIPKIKENLPPSYANYYEPFLGGGSVLIHLLPENNCYVNDINSSLINFYQKVKDSSKDLIEGIQKIQDIFLEKEDKRNFYFNLRAYFNKIKGENSLENAILTYIINRICFQGLWRENSKGEFNTAYGKPYFTNNYKSDFYELSHYFNEKDIKFYNLDYKKFLTLPKSKDFVYLDPPYPTNSKKWNYSKTSFNQEELKEIIDKLTKKGVKIMESNNDIPFIKELYKDYNIREVSTRWSICPTANMNTKGKKELIITNY